MAVTAFDRRLDHHRHLQRARGSRALPRVAARSSTGTLHEIIVVDNQSEDGSADAAERWPTVRVIRTSQISVSRARPTSASARATGTNVLLLNSDTIVPPGAIDRLLASWTGIRTSPWWGLASSTAPGNAELSFGRMIGPINELRQKRRAAV